MTDAAEVITTTLAGRTFRATRRTAAHLEWTIEQLEARGGTMRIYQTCFNVGVAASAGTHDGDAVFDFDDLGLGWPESQRFLRECGWAAWWRNTGSWADPSNWHNHAVSLGYPGQVGIYVPGQVSDYYAGRSGLAGHVADPTWHPADIDSTIFDYPRWLEEHEMTPEQDARLAAIEKRAAETFSLIERLAAAEQKRATDELKRDRSSWKREAALAAEVKRLGGDVDKVLKAVEAES